MPRGVEFLLACLLRGLETAPGTIIRRLLIHYLSSLKIIARFLAFCSLVLLSLGLSAQAEEQRHIDLGERSAMQWGQVLTTTAEMVGSGEKIAHLSSAFLNTSYRENSLIGSPERDEVLVMDLAGVDCFTLLDYVEAFRRSAQLSDAIDILKQVRYRDGLVTYRQRNHFFSDWQRHNADRIADVTVAIGQGRAVTVSKQLNRKQDGSLWLVGIPVALRQIDYIPVVQVDRQLVDALRTGDYVGIFSELPGLDVSHTGIIIKAGGRTVLRHASSQDRLRKVVDSDLLDYLEGKPGMVIYRPR